MGRYQNLVFIIPAFNEQDTIAGVVFKLSPLGDVLVVNDCSSDRTHEQAEKSGAIVLDCVKNMGYDGALTAGFQRAQEKGYRYFVTCDADGQHPLSAITQVCDLITGNDGLDLAIGRRATHQRVTEKIFSCFTDALYGIDDPLCGLKAYTKRALAMQGYFDSYNSIGTELALRIAKKKMAFVEVPFEAPPRKDQPRFGTGFRANYKIFKSMLNWILIHQFKQ